MTPGAQQGLDQPEKCSLIIGVTVSMAKAGVECSKFDDNLSSTSSVRGPGSATEYDGDYVRSNNYLNTT